MLTQKGKAGVGTARAQVLKGGAQCVWELKRDGVAGGERVSVVTAELGARLGMAENRSKITWWRLGSESGGGPGLGWGQDKTFVDNLRSAHLLQPT